MAGNRQPLLIYTDGCCDPDPNSESGVSSGYGAVMFDPEDNVYEYFRKDMSEELKWFLTLQGQKAQIVGQAEVLPCLLARRMWSERMTDRAVHYFIDNDAARFGFIKGISDDPHLSVMLTCFWEEERITPPTHGLPGSPPLGTLQTTPVRGDPPCVCCVRKVRTRFTQTKGWWTRSSRAPYWQLGHMVSSLRWSKRKEGVYF